MQITVDLPDDLTQHANPGREALEALAIEGYRSGVLSAQQMGAMLGLHRLEVDGFLKNRGVVEGEYDVSDLERETETLRRLTERAQSNLVVVADTSPVNYLVQIEQGGLLRLLFDRVAIPAAVLSELQHQKAPAKVRDWIQRQSDWLDTYTVFVNADEMPQLDMGEREAIRLAERLQAGLVLMDYRSAIQEALRRGFEAIGTLGVLVRAGERGLIDLSASAERLFRETNFRISAEAKERFRSRYLRP